MGRALFSQIYAPPTVRTEPEPTIEKWGVWNKFDPDSDEFFNNAEFEAFINPGDPQYQRQQEDSIVVVEVEGSSDLTSSSEGSVSDRGSPMAVGPDDPAIMIADVFSHSQWSTGSDNWPDSRIDDLAETEWRSITNNRNPTDALSYNVSRATSVFARADSARALNDRLARVPVNTLTPFFPSSLRNSTTANELFPEAPRSPTLRRSINITPINIPIEPSIPSPMSPGSPMTPPPQRYLLQTPQTMLTPSPPPTVSPRIYRWQHHPLPIGPTSPTIARDGPLPNHRARRSSVQIDVSPAPVLVQNVAM